MSIVVQLERFEGPLGLLLHLIREQEMDVFNINVNQITRQYLEYIKTMRKLDLEVAGEFVAMAATLIHLKSRMLLPQYNEEGEEVAEDPRKELVQKLVEYKKYQELSGQLYQRPLLGRDVLTRGERTKVEPVAEGELVLAENPLFSLIAAYRFACKNMKKGVHKVAGELQSIAARILEMRELLVAGHRLLFRDLLDKNAESKSNHVLVTFLSLLELAKMGFVSVFQTEPLSDIHVESKRTVDRDVVSNVESYDSVNAAMVVDEILSEAQLTLNEPVDDDDQPTEEPGIGREAFTDAASDDDIAAEERRLFSEEGVFEPAASEAVESEIASGAEDLHLSLVPDQEADPSVEAELHFETALAQVANTEVTPSEAPVEDEAPTALDAAASEPMASESSIEADSRFEMESVSTPDGESTNEVGPDVTSDAAPDVDTSSLLEASADASIEPTPDLGAEPTMEFGEHSSAKSSESADVSSAPSLDETTAEPIEASAETTDESKSVAPPEPPAAKAAAPDDASKRNVDSALAAALDAFNAFGDEPGRPKNRPPEVDS